jgi:stalled ribosome rescue protein Dom34
MIIKDAKGSSEKAYYVIPEDADDLFTVRRIIEKDDQVISVTSRVIKQVKEHQDLTKEIASRLESPSMSKRLALTVLLIDYEFQALSQILTTI